LLDFACGVYFVFISFYKLCIVFARDIKALPQTLAAKWLRTWSPVLVFAPPHVFDAVLFDFSISAQPLSSILDAADA
jgi:hypothetical protein